MGRVPVDGLPLPHQIGGANVERHGRLACTICYFDAAAPSGLVGKETAIAYKNKTREIGNIAELANLLGHSSIETTRLYAATSHSEKMESLGKLDL